MDENKGIPNMRFQLEQEVDYDGFHGRFSTVKVVKIIIAVGLLRPEYLVRTRGGAEFYAGDIELSLPAVRV